MVRRVGGMLLPACYPETEAEIEAYLAERRRERAIEQRERQWRERLEAFEPESRLPN